MPLFDAPAGSDSASNGKVAVAAAAVDRRAPTCSHPEHRHSDYALPTATMWVCGTCRPPGPAIIAYGIVWRYPQEARR